MEFTSVDLEVLEEGIEDCDEVNTCCSTSNSRT